MVWAGGKAQMAMIFRWSTEAKIEMAEVLAAGLGMAGPVLLATMSGHLGPGLAAAIGSLAVGGIETASSNIKAQAKSEAAALAPAALAAFLAVLVGGHGWLTDAMLVLLAGVAATIGGYSRFMTATTKRFILFLMIVNAAVSSSCSMEASHAAGLLLLVVAGALWTSVLALLFGTLARMRGSVMPSMVGPSAATATTSQKFTRWKRSLANLAGWQYTLRLAVGLGLAAALRSLLPDHHLNWIALTVAIVTPRNIEPVPIKMTQRALGTAIGVGAASLFLTFELPSLALVVAIGLLASARRLLKAKSYLAYSAVMTPLILLIMDAGRPVESGLLIDRQVATLTGIVLVVATNLLFGKSCRRALLLAKKPSTGHA